MYRTFTLALASLLVTNVSADGSVVAGERIETVPIQGIHLNMTPSAAFDFLAGAGFRAGYLEDYEDWKDPGIEFVRGEYGSREGYSSVTFQRNGERIVYISETWNAPGNPLDAEAEIGAARRHFGLPSDSPKCNVAGPHRGVCEVQDAEEDPDVRLAYTLQIATTMRIVTVTRTRELGGAAER